MYDLLNRKTGISVPNGADIFIFARGVHMVTGPPKLLSSKYQGKAVGV
jgi:hypothetical protein